MAKLIFENANVFDGDSPKLAKNMSVLVEGNEIRKVSRDKIRAEGAQRIDCAGKTLMPGLIDNHVHIYIESLKLTPPEPPMTYRAQYANKFVTHILSCGFTTIRDVAGGDRGMAMALRDGFLTGPRYFYGGLCLSQTGGHGDMRTPDQAPDYCTCGAELNFLAHIADGVDACIKASREELRKGASHIKIMGSGGVMSPTDPLDKPQYSEAEIRAIVQEASRRGAYVCSHCHPPDAIRLSVEYGVRSIEHGTLIDAPTAGFVAKKGAYVVPTMAVIQALTDDGPEMGMPVESQEKLRRVHEQAVRGLEIMKREGVKMGFGTDLLGYQHVRQGIEFTIRRQVLQPIDILRSATSINAEILQMKDKLGVVKAGALADLLVVDGNPLENIELLAANGKHLSHIVLDGKLVKGA
ncbi:MAG TPA: amidohydrolase family protein [Nevskiaceae bacterium]|nr:amidohydrolase family protein [Nevskiaceae bacterium]